MSVQARCERLHVQRAPRVLVTSAYSAAQAMKFYGLRKRPAIVPELIDLEEWRRMLAAHPAEPRGFTLLFVGRFYRRKRVDVLLRAAAMLRDRMPDLAVRIVGNGPCNARVAGAIARSAAGWHGDLAGRCFARRSWPRNTTAPTRSACRACRKASALCCWKRWRRESRSSPLVLRPFRRWRRTRCSSSPITRKRWPRESSGYAGASPAHREWVEQFDAELVARRFLEAVKE